MYLSFSIVFNNSNISFYFSTFRMLPSSPTSPPSYTTASVAAVSSDPPNGESLSESLHSGSSNSSSSAGQASNTGLAQTVQSQQGPPGGNSVPLPYALLYKNCLQPYLQQQQHNQQQYANNALLYGHSGTAPGTGYYQHPVNQQPSPVQHASYADEMSSTEVYHHQRHSLTPLRPCRLLSTSTPQQPYGQHLQR